MYRVAPMQQPSVFPGWKLTQEQPYSSVWTNRWHLGKSVWMKAKTPDIRINEFQLKNRLIDPIEPFKKRTEYFYSVPWLDEGCSEFTKYLMSNEVTPLWFHQIDESRNEWTARGRIFHFFWYRGKLCTIKSPKTFKDLTIWQVRWWLGGHPQENQTYASHVFRKYAKHKNWLTREYGALYRVFQRCRTSVIFTMVCFQTLATWDLVQNSQLSGHLGMNKTITEFRLNFFFFWVCWNFF